MLTRDDLLKALAAIHVTAPVRADEVTPSTSETAATMAEDGAPQWTLVAAGHQTHGRGRMGRTWEDVPGKALMCSMVLRPSGLAPNRAGLLSLLAGASMADAIRSQSGRRVRTKWPNDLQLDGKKVGGILLQSSIEAGTIRHVIVGMGVNLEAPEGVEGAGSIGEVSMRDLLIAFLLRFEDVYTAVEPSFPERVRVAWLPTAATIGQLVEATTTSGEAVTGRAVGIDEFGALRLSTDHGEVKVGFGDVEHLGEG